MKTIKLCVIALLCFAGCNPNDSSGVSTVTHFGDVSLGYGADSIGVRKGDSISVHHLTAGTMTSLTKGYTYTLSPSILPAVPANSPSLVTPIINGHEAGFPMVMTLAVDSLSPVLVTFQLPSVVSDSSGIHQLACSFSPGSLFRDGSADGDSAANGLYNPNVSNTFLVGTRGGTLTLCLGITVAIPENVFATNYRGTVACTVSITGM
ncbi:MAG TPA: hypothetical protein VKS81_11445 [Bacteroidota bacterium]|nr:hypothetical protein [Bacteroidota bacterium]